jgi:rubrerythrin
MAMDRKDIIETAIQLERDGRKFYHNAAEKASNDIARQMFESLAEDEVRHIEWLESVSSGTHTAGSVNRALYGRLSGIFKDAPEGARKAVATCEDDINAMRLAIEMEEKSAAAYATWAEESETEDVRGLCEMLADVERFHRELIENSIEYLEHPGDWFMVEEGWHFDGG